MELLLIGAGIASALWGAVTCWLLYRHRRHVQAALNLPAASSHAELHTRLSLRGAPRGPVR